MTVTWEPPPDLDAGARVTYDIAWIASEEAEEPDARWATIREVRDLPRHHVLGPSGIRNGVSYDVRMRAVTDHAGQWSEAATTTTFERSHRGGPEKSRPAIPFDVPIGAFSDASGFDAFKIEVATRTGLLVRTGGSVENTECWLTYSSGWPVPGTDTARAGSPPYASEQCSVFVILDPGTYYLLVGGHNQLFSSLHHGSYFVRARTVPPTGRSLEAALPIAVGEQRFGYFGKDEDGTEFWRLDVDEREFIDVHVEYLAGSSPRLSLWIGPRLAARFDRCAAERPRDAFVLIVQRPHVLLLRRANAGRVGGGDLLHQGQPQ